MTNADVDRVVPPLRDGITDREAPFFRGDTAERIIEGRRAKKSSKKRRARPSQSSDNESDQDDTRRYKRKTLRRLERVLPKRKTLAAKQRLRKRIKNLRRELGEDE